MRNHGRLTDWKDERGFGFVTPDDGSERVFIHVRAFARSRSRPLVGEAITYDLAIDPQRRIRAINAQAAGEEARFIQRKPSAHRGIAGLLAGICILALCTYLVTTGSLPLWIPVTYLGMSVISFLAYGVDKSAALDSRERLSEATLHFIDFLGGWPGALIAQAVYRHKTSKRSFRNAFWVSVVANLVVVAVAVTFSLWR